MLVCAAHHSEHSLQTLIIQSGKTRNMASFKISLVVVFCFIVLALTMCPSRAQNSAQDYIDAHNAARAEVGVGPMSWDDTVAAYAQAYVNDRINDCGLVHSQGPQGPYGENLAEGSGDFTGTDAVNLWVSEKSDYDYSTNSCAFGGVCRHYAQVVWRSSVRLGCARVQCRNNGWWFVSCNYDPLGNVIGQRPYTEAAFEVQNLCTYTVWAAAIPGGGRRLDSGQTWTFNVPANTTEGRIWGRTNCSFKSSGHGSCQTGDCGGVLQCTAYGAPPVTLAEFSLDQYNNLDFFDMSLVNGFNVPMDFGPTCSTVGIRCTSDINGQCPNVLRAPGGCNDPCTVFKTNQYCCNSGSCELTDYSRFFKERCPNAHSYPKDDQNTTFTSCTGTNYRVVFCPSAKI